MHSVAWHTSYSIGKTGTAIYSRSRSFRERTKSSWQLYPFTRGYWTAHIHMHAYQWVRCMHPFWKGEWISNSIYYALGWTLTWHWQKTAPYCQDFGNKERVRCEWDDPDLAENLRNQTTLYDFDAISLPSYRGCPHVKRIERWKFIKFEVCICLALLCISCWWMVHCRASISWWQSSRWHWSCGDKGNWHENNIKNLHKELA